MQTQTNAKKGLHIIGSYLFNFGILAGVATVTFGLTSCGGGGGGGGGASSGSSTSPTLSQILSGSSYGVVASSVPRALTIYGTNFTSGMNLGIATSSGVTTGMSITASSVKSTTLMAVSAVIPTAPSDNYVVFAIKSSSGTTTLASKVFGVASGPTKTLGQIQSIFTIAQPGPGCTSCHSSSNVGNGYLNLNDTNALFAKGNKCNDRDRVSPGDPRRSSSLLIDKLKSSTLSLPCNDNPMPPSGYSISAEQIQDIVDWVAAGAHNLAQY